MIRRLVRDPRAIAVAALAVVAAAIGAVIAVDPLGRTAPAPAIADQPAHSFAIRSVRIFDGERVIERGTIVVRNGLIEAVGAEVDPPTDLPVYDGSGHTVLPGLIDAHTHRWPGSLADALRFGVTTELDMFMHWRGLAEAKRHRASLDRTAEADLWSAGLLVTAPGGHGTQYSVLVSTLDSADDAAELVADRVRDGSDFIKLVVEPGNGTLPTLSPDEVDAVVAAAHDHGKLAVTHVSRLADAWTVVRAGGDGLAHIFVDEVADAAFVAAATESGLFVVPTLLFHDYCRGAARNLLDDSTVAMYLSPNQQDTLAQTSPLGCQPEYPEYMAVMQENVRLLHAAGVPILAGTDAANAGTAHGAGMFAELELLVEAGLSPVDALEAATSAPAREFALADRGRLAPGLRGDVLLVRGDPTNDITTVRDIAAIWKNGYWINRTP